MRRKKSFKKPVVLGLAVVYLTTMLLATYRVKEKFAEDYRQRLELAAAQILNRASEWELLVQQGERSQEEQKNFYQALANEYFYTTGKSALQLSVAFYDKNQSLLAKSRNEIGQRLWSGTEKKGYGAYGLEEFLSPAEQEQFAGYWWENIRLSDPNLPEKYRFSIKVSPVDQKLLGIFVQEITWEEKSSASEERYVDPLFQSVCSTEIGVSIDYETGQETEDNLIFYETDSKIVWQWENPEVSASLQKTGQLQTAGILFPYRDSYESWMKWMGSSYLQDYPQAGTFSWDTETEIAELEIDSDDLYYRGRYQLQVKMAEEPSVYMEIRMEERPWLAAVHYMKYAYVMGLLLVLACMGKIIYVFQKIYEKQAVLEETRRDFTNAIAHELKTPLSVIRNFAENLMEHNMEEKRDYYLSQIIGQTEEMDHLVEEMIEVSKLDSEDLILGSETLSFTDLIREQMERFQPILQEKGIRADYEQQGDFVVKGDRVYLEKALWNLLSNAVDYNIPDGKILIRTEAEGCVIENTGLPMEEEQLLHAFDLFYTGEKSRGGEKKHMGMGLYLAKKILGLHRLSLSLENRKEGVRAVIRRA